jgi:hypothetical protein
MVLHNHDGSAILARSIGDLRKLAYPSRVVLVDGAGGSASSCLCSVDWEKTGPILAQRVEYECGRLFLRPIPPDEQGRSAIERMPLRRKEKHRRR